MQGLTPSGFAPTLISQQQGNQLPDPTGLAAAIDLLKANAFNNLTGLEGNQKNAIEALKINAEAAKGYAETAADLAKSAEIPKNGDAVAESIRKNVKDPEKQQELIENYYDKMLGKKTAPKRFGGMEQPENNNGVMELGAKSLFESVKNSSKGKAKVELPDGTKIETEHEDLTNALLPENNSDSYDLDNFTIEELEMITEARNEKFEFLIPFSPLT
jgi:hypothetical protein